MAKQKDNEGNWNLGNGNLGNGNLGNGNLGNGNLGNWNLGNWNLANWNLGDWNLGNGNLGNGNLGNWNLGNWNLGDWNLGDWNLGNGNLGYFNTETPTTVNVFDIPTNKYEWDECDKPEFIYFNLTVWVNMEEMTDIEKEENPNYGNTEGYLKKLDYKEEFKKSYEKANKEDRDKIFNIPNFNAKKFFEISGIDVKKYTEQEKKKAELIAKAHELLDQAKLM